MIRTFQGKTPTSDAGVWIADSAEVIGDVSLGRDASVWYQTLIRGDVSQVRIGQRSNVQDHCTIHVSRDHGPTIIGNDVTLGHRVVAHGCRIDDGALIGIGSVLLDHSVVESGAMVAAMSLLAPGTVVPAGMLAMGQPAKVVREVSSEERQWMIETISNYVALARLHARSE